MYLYIYRPNTPITQFVWVKVLIHYWVSGEYSRKVSQRLWDRTLELPSDDTFHPVNWGRDWDFEIQNPFCMFPKPLLRQNKKSKTPIWWNSKPPLGDFKIQNHYLAIQKIKTPIWHISKSKPLNRYFQTPKILKIWEKTPIGVWKFSKPPYYDNIFLMHAAESDVG